jgi:predicted restriction endonuclease
MGWEVKRQGNREFNTRVFILDFDGEYLTPNQGDDPDDRPRDRVMQEIAVRRGATAFRNSQLKRFCKQCAISGCTLVDVLEAAHIRAYRAEYDNNQKNGILLRSDLHTLFDLDLLAVNPTNQSVAIHKSVIEKQYSQFHGRDLCVIPADGFDEAAVRQRWAKFSGR